MILDRRRRLAARTDTEASSSACCCSWARVKGRRGVAIGSTGESLVAAMDDEAMAGEGEAKLPIKMGVSRTMPSSPHSDDGVDGAAGDASVIRPPLMPLLFGVPCMFSSVVGDSITGVIAGCCGGTGGGGEYSKQ